MLPFPTPSGLETNRLFLRSLEQKDAGPLFVNYTSIEEVARYLPWRVHRDPIETQAMLQHAEICAANRSADLLAIVLRSHSSDPIGLINLGDSEHGISVGFGIAPAYWNKGYGQEIMKAVTNWLLRQPSVWRVWAYCDEENEASTNALIRAGMQFEGTLRRFATHPNLSPEPRSCRIYAAVRV